ncbi:hypothetical protein EV360DRAFT_65657 [Lentinula raphanica]|nr:hypothetical protein EV360DRAFT_65657 [Lentinula raphanica]
MLRVSTTVLITISLLSVIVQPVVAAPVNNNLLPRKDNQLFSREYPGMSPPPFEPGRSPQFSGQSESRTDQATTLVTAGSGAVTSLVEFGKVTGANKAIKEGWDETKGKYQNMKQTVAEKENNFKAKIPGTAAHRDEKEQKAEEKALENGDDSKRPEPVSKTTMEVIIDVLKRPRNFRCCNFNRCYLGGGYEGRSQFREVFISDLDLNRCSIPTNFCQALSLDILVIIRFFQTRAMLKLSTTSVFVVTASLSVIVGAFPMLLKACPNTVPPTIFKKETVFLLFKLVSSSRRIRVRLSIFSCLWPVVEIDHFQVAGPPDSFGGGMSPGSAFSEPAAFGSSPDETNGANVPTGRAGQIAEFGKASAGAASAVTQALVVTNTLPTVKKAWHEGVQKTKEKYQEVKGKVVGEKNKLENLKLPFHQKHSKHQPPTPAMTPSDDNELTERSLHDSDDQVPDVSSYL